MKKILRSVAFLLLLFSFLPSAYSQKKVSVDIPFTELIANLGETKTIEITITNNQPVADAFKLSALPQFYSGISLLLEKSLVMLSPHSSTKVKLTFFVSECIETIGVTFSVTAQSVNDPNVTDKDSVILKVKGEGFTCITKLSTDKLYYDGGENVKIEVDVKNYGESDTFTLETRVKKDGKEITSFSDEFLIHRKEERKFEYTFTLEKYALGGKYEVESLLKKDNQVVSSKYQTFNVKEFSIPIHSRKTENYFIFQRIRIRIKNDGNSELESFTEKVTLPFYLDLFFYSPQPFKKERVGGSFVYEWTVPTLKPLETYEVVYEIRFWNIWFVAFIVFLGSFLFFKYYYSVKIIKGFKPVSRLSKDVEIPISIEIKNKTLKEFKNVEVKDYIPPVVSLIKKFVSLKPKIKSVGDRLELTWKIPVLGPGEEIVLGYRIKPLLEIIGNLHLPPAVITYLENGKRKKKIVSKGIVVG